MPGQRAADRRRSRAARPGRRRACSACATRWASSACTPGQRGEDLDGRDAARGGVALVGRGDVAAQLAGDTAQGAKAEHGRYDSRGAACARSCTAGRVRVPNTGRPGWRAAAHGGRPRPVPGAAGLRRALPRPLGHGLPLASSARLAARQDDERVVVAHSLGCVLWLREAARDRAIAARRPRRARRSAVPRRGGPGARRLLPDGRRRKAAIALAARETRLICTDNDPYCPGQGAAAPLGRSRSG